MSERHRVVIHNLSTGVPGLDEVLGGGVPEFAFNLIAGAPGTGKTTLAQQIMFANATPERPGLFFTVLGEPPVKMLRYQQQFDFFDVSRVGRDVHFMNLSQEVLERNLDAVLERISAEVERHNPSIVVVDSFRTVVSSFETPQASEMELQHFVQRLALRLTSWETTSFLIGEFHKDESRAPVFTVADGVVWLYNEAEANATVRKLRATKMRGRASLPGLHTMRISSHGIEVYPRHYKKPSTGHRSAQAPRVSTGVGELDVMMNGGVPKGDSVLIAGPSGSGKSILGQHFAWQGMQDGERVLVAVFEEYPEIYMSRSKALGFDFDRMEREGLLQLMYLRQTDLSVDETLHELRNRVAHDNVSRVIIDSINGFEASLAPSYRDDFRDSYHRLVLSLSSLGVTSYSLVELATPEDYLRSSPFNISFLCDDIVALRYRERERRIDRLLTVVKMRGSAHSTDVRRVMISSKGIALDASRE